MNPIQSYHHHRVIPVLFLVILLGVSPISSVYAQQTFKEIAVKKPRVIVLTDIGNEPDDQESMVRFLAYSNEFDVDGLIATTSTHLENTVNPDVIKKLVHSYGKVRSNLAKNAPGYPTKQYLLSRIKAHLPVFGMQGVGKGKNSEGSQLIINTVDKADHFC